MKPETPARVFIRTSTFVNNTAAKDGSGGAVYIEEDTSGAPTPALPAFNWPVQLTASNFTKNTAGGEAGAIRAGRSINAENVVFSGNQAQARRRVLSELPCPDASTSRLRASADAARARAVSPVDRAVPAGLSALAAGPTVRGSFSARSSTTMPWATGAPSRSSRTGAQSAPPPSPFWCECCHSTQLRQQP